MIYKLSLIDCLSAACTVTQLSSALPFPTHLHHHTLAFTQTFTHVHRLICSLICTGLHSFAPPHPCFHTDLHSCAQAHLHSLICTGLHSLAPPHPCFHTDLHSCAQAHLHSLICTGLHSLAPPHPCFHTDLHSCAQAHLHSLICTDLHSFAPPHLHLHTDLYQRGHHFPDSSACGSCCAVAHRNGGRHESSSLLGRAPRLCAHCE